MYAEFFSTIQDSQDVHDFAGELISCRELFVGHTSSDSHVSCYSSIFVHVSPIFVAFYETVSAENCGDPGHVGGWLQVSVLRQHPHGVVVAPIGC